MSDCDVCDNFEALVKATCDEKAYRWHVLKSLCYIIEQLSAEAAPALTPTVIPQVAWGYSDLAASFTNFASTTFLTAAKQLNFLRVVNTTDCDVDFSYDGGNEIAFTVLKAKEYTSNLPLTFSSLNSFKMKRTAGQSATSGNLFIEGGYYS